MRERSTMSKKLQKYLDEAEKTESRILELEEYLKQIRAAQKKEEESEMIRALRSTKLCGRELLALLENIQAGNVTFQFGEIGEESNGEAQASAKEEENVIEEND